MRVLVNSLGCRLNEAESQQWSKELMDAGHELAQDDADLIVVNTCAVTSEAARKSRQRVRKLSRENPRAKIVATGCQATLEGAKLDAETIIIQNADKDSLIGNISDVLGWQKAPKPLNQRNEYAMRGKSKAFIKVQDGCRHKCAYCIVTVARGEERSRTSDDIIEQVLGLHESGVLEIVLTGVHVGGYGTDLGTDLTALVNRILDETEMPRIRFASVEPWEIPDEYFLLFENSRVMPHIHLPIQSGSDTVLKRMYRRGRTEEFRELVRKARAVAPDFNVTTDIIAGFPGETEAEWQETLDFVREIGFGHIHAFPFSARGGTRAAAFDEQVDIPLRKARCNELIELASSQTQRMLQAQVGQTVDVLVEKGGTTGYTPNFLPVSFAELQPGIQKVRLAAVDVEANVLRGVSDAAVRLPIVA